MKVVLSIAGSVFVALALIWFLGISGGQALNEIKRGLGDSLWWGGWAAFLALIIFAAIYAIKGNG